MKLTKNDFAYDEEADHVILDVNAALNITGEDFYQKLIDVILQNQKVVERLKKRIAELEQEIKEEEENLSNVSQGFKEMQYRYIDSMERTNKELQKILGDKK